MKRKWLAAPVLAFWLMLEAICGVAGANSQVPYPEPPMYTTPYGCYDTIQGADGPQVGASNIATIITSTAAQPPYSTHIKVVVSEGYWLMQVRGGWIAPDQTIGGFVWSNPDGLANSSYETDGYGAGFGVVAVACPWPCTRLSPTSTTSAVQQEPYCSAPPTTEVAQVVPSTTMPPSSTTTTQEVARPVPEVRAVVAVPNFTG